MKLSESCLVVCALVASLGSAGAAEADDFKALYARADLGGSMRGTALMRSPSRIKEQKPLARADGHADGGHRRGGAAHDFRAGSVVVGVEMDVETMKLYDGKGTTATYSCCASVNHDAVKTF